ncbi:MAG TPA: hypothetical protein VK815_10785 [Candidatus Acidoferrales bacterium]|jgi:hypothetical protein|nr:hypothetical protein [Candidatus Acidoferrales bacterium]
MSYHVDPEIGEKVEANIELCLSKKSKPFYFAVSDRAIYIPRVKLIAKSDPYYFERVPLSQVIHVAVRRLPPYALWLLAGLMIVGGLLTTFWMMEPVLRKEPGDHRISGWPIAVFVGGILLPFAARGRFGLDIEYGGGKYRWRPPLVVDKASKQEIADTFQTIIAACEKGGTRVIDERNK